MKRILTIICAMLLVLGVSAKTKKVIVVYFSATGTTESVAKELAKEKKAELYAITPARRGGATAAMEVLNKYFLKTNMPVVPSQYWSIAHGTTPGEVHQDQEGMQTMRQLGLNMAFMIKSFQLGMKAFGSPKIKEELVETHYIR